MKKYIAAAVAGVALALSTAAHADYINDYVQLEIGIGAAKYATTDGRWYQENIPGGSHLVSKPPAWSIGFAGPVISRGAWGIDWHAGYTNLGRAAASCSCSPQDENYNASTHTYDNKTGAHTAFFTGSGRSQGVELTIEPYRWLYGVRIGAEAGIFVHRDSWDEDVAGWQLLGMPQAQNLHLSDTYWSVAPIVGASIGNGRFTVSYKHFFTGLNSRGRTTPPLWDDADLVELRVKF